MRILWLTVDRSHRVAHHFDDFREAVSKIADVTTLKKYPAGDKGQNLWHLSRRLLSKDIITENIVLNHLLGDSNYDYIFSDAFFAYTHEDWDKITIPSAIFIEDVHGHVPRFQLNIAKTVGIKTVFHRFNHAFHRHHADARSSFSCFWLPHSINMERFSDTIEKTINVLHVGAYTESVYPFRYAAIKALNGKSYFKQIERPRDLSGTPRQSKWPIDRDYDNLLQSADICITGGSVFHAPVQKFFEIPAANSLLLSDWFSDLGMLGFVPNKNMVPSYKENVLRVVEDLLSNPDEIKRISTSGHELIQSNHTSEIRSRQFINMICQVLDRPLEFPDISPCSFNVNFNYGIPFQEPKQEQEHEYVSVSPGTDWRSRIIAAEAADA